MNVFLKAAFGTFFLASSAYGDIWPIGETCDNPGTYRACENAGLTCNDQTAVCEGSSDAILGRTCDIPTNYSFCERAGYWCNDQTAICEEIQ